MTASIMVGTIQTGIRRFGTTVDYAFVPEWVERAHRIEPRLGKDPGIRKQLQVFVGILRAARHERALLLDSSSGNLHTELFASALLGLLPGPRPVIVLAGCMWDKDHGLKGLIERLLVRLADRAVSFYAVQSSEEMRLFPQAWGVSPSKMRLCPYFYTITDKDRAPFAGGNSHRDYTPLLEAARRLPHLRFVIATDRLEHELHIPENVTVGPVSHMEFMSLLQGAHVVVVPLRQGLTRAVGQQTYLNAMLLGKPTIVNEVHGVHDHIQHKQTALVVDGTPESYVEMLEWVYDTANHDNIETMRLRAQEVVARDFNYERHVMCLLRIVDEALG